MPYDRPQLPDRRPAGRSRGAGAILLGAAAWGSTGTAAHFGPPAASSASIGAARIAVGGLLLFAFAVSTSARRCSVRRLLAVGGATRASLVLAAGAVAGYQVCFFTAVRMTGVAIGTVVAIGSAPVFTGALSRLAGGPRLDVRWMAATAAAVAGCAVLVTGGHAAGVNAGGVGLALAAGLCYAIYAVTASRLISAGNPEAVVMGLLFGGAAVLLSPVLVVGSSAWLLTGRGVAVTAYLGVVTTALAYLLYGRGRRLGAGGGHPGPGRARRCGDPGSRRPRRAADSDWRRRAGPSGAGSGDARRQSGARSAAVKPAGLVGTAVHDQVWNSCCHPGAASHAPRRTSAAADRRKAVG